MLHLEHGVQVSEVWAEDVEREVGEVLSVRLRGLNESGSGYGEGQRHHGEPHQDTQAQA